MMTSSKLLQHVINGEVDQLAQILKENPEILDEALDDEGNTALHWAALVQREDVLGLLLNHTSRQGPQGRGDFVATKNLAGKTALDLAVEAGNRRIAWTLIQCGRLSGEISKTNLYQSVPDFENGNSFLHVYAKNNYDDEIKKFVDSCDDQTVFLDLSLKPNVLGDTPAMTAAKQGHKAALLALLQPMILSKDKKFLDQFLHHTNKEGHQLLSYVSHHQRTLSVIHGILIELETFVHNHDAYSVKLCLRTSLGSSMAAKFSTDLFQRLRHEQGSVGKAFIFVRILTLTFIVRMAVMLMDMYTDAMLLQDYWRQWLRQDDDAASMVLFPGVIAPSKNPCLETALEERNGTIVASHVWVTGNTTLGCYPGAIRGRDRFISTLSFLLMPFFLFFFELLRFRVLSRWLEELNGGNLCHYFFRPIGNLALWLVWPVVAFVRQAWYRFRYETSSKESKIWQFKALASRAFLISSRAQMIEVCTEASLQPLFQFYLVFQDVLHLDLSAGSTTMTVAEAFNFALDAHRRQIASVLVSLFTLAWSYTMQYRHNKENSLSAMATLIYFLSISSLIVSRILCFEMFAYYLGPGYLGHAMIAVASHILLMSALHFIFSDSLAQCRKAKKRQSWLNWLRQFLLVLHNCCLNGLANLYVHNNLEIFVQKSDTTECNYVRSDVRQQTFLRQSLFDIVIFGENLAMIYLAKDTVTKTSNFLDIYTTMVIIIMTCYCVGMALKVFFYLWCHPWAELVRPQSFCRFATSCICCSKQVDISVNGCCQIEMTGNKATDIQRYKSISMLLPRRKLSNISHVLEIKEGEGTDV